jgi:MFS transporter, MHS family, shikimate and dehydroshikimate transport protein
MAWGQHTDRAVQVPDTREHGNHLDTSHRSSDGSLFRSSRKVAFAGLIGTTIEWYDFFIFGTAAALVFNEVFFPSFDPVTGTLAAFASFSVGFIARPFGGAVFAHYGDKIGRKPMLVYSLLVMGAATVLMGLLPGYASIGIWAPILLVALRFAQGFGVGGEWGGAALMAVEHAPDHRRGFYGAWPQVGVPAGIVLGTGTYALLSATLSDEQFLEWGWRVPFLASALLIALGMWIRLTVAESPIFQETLDAKSVAKMPVLDALKTYPKEIVLAAGSFVATHATFYVGSVWLAPGTSRPTPSLL